MHPKNLQATGLEHVVVVLDATELEILRVWLKGVAYVLFFSVQASSDGQVLGGYNPRRVDLLGVQHVRG